MRSAITQERLRELLHYNPDKGSWTWLKGSAFCVKVGSTVDSVNDKGYVRFNIDKKSYYGHRLAWFYMTGEWPKVVVDHIDGDRLNNRWSNLRAATKAINSQNQKKAHCQSRIGLMGVTQDGKKYRAQITLNGRTRRLGTFGTPEEAHAFYLATKRRLHEGCTI